MTTAVVMCTYNGKKYILEQLTSIYNQSQKPDMVYIQDDRSTDNTVSIIEQFISENDLSSTWKVHVNDENLGWKKSFMDAIKKTSAELIFLSDQDDIWNPDKIRIMADICSNNPDIELLVSRHEPFDTYTGKEVKIYQPSFGKKPLTKVKLDGAFTECRRPGCTYAVSAKLKQYIDSIWQPDWPHDQFFWCISIARGTLWSYNKTLVKFRRHESNNTPSNEKKSQTRKDIIEKAIQIADSIADNSDMLSVSMKRRKLIRNTASVFRTRKEAIDQKSIIKALSLLFNIDKYPRFRAWIADLLVVMNK